MSGAVRQLEAPDDPAMVNVGPYGQGATEIDRPVGGEPCSPVTVIHIKPSLLERTSHGMVISNLESLRSVGSSLLTNNGVIRSQANWTLGITSEPDGSGRAGAMSRLEAV